MTSGAAPLQPCVVIPTRGRPELCRQALTSVLQARPSGCQVVVIDQSDDRRTEEAICEIAPGSSGVLYVRSAGRGASAARNEGVRHAEGDLLLFTDDDCEVDPQWVQHWCQVFENQPALGIAFGNVACPWFDPALGHTPTFDPGAASHSHGRELFQQGAGAIGLSANMALRRQVWRAVGGLDEGLGAGSRFPGAEEVDLAYRIVRAGHRLGHVADAAVLHYGFRPGRSASRLAQGYAVGTAAMYLKHVRCGDWFAARLLLTEAWLLFYGVVRGVLTGRRPLGLRSLLAYGKGLAAALRSPVDPGRRLYRTENRGGLA